MHRFEMNGYHWTIREVAPYNDVLIDRTGTRTVATTDPSIQEIYISDELRGDFKSRVIIHELAHAVMFSYYLVDDVHSVVPPDQWLIAEEMLCNLIADYGRKIFEVYSGLAL